MTLLSFKRLRHMSYHRRSIVPCLFTLLNAFLGFIAVLEAMQGEYGYAALCIGSAALMDVLDGHIARAWDVVSHIGVELDSLSDAISFCMAPAIMFYCWCSAYEPLLGLFVAFVYLAAGLLRLARFNAVDSAELSSCLGLPTTAAALIAAVLMAVYSATFVARKLVAVGMIGLASLMISKIRFPLFKKCSIRYLILLYCVPLFVCAYWFLVNSCMQDLFPYS